MKRNSIFTSVLILGFVVLGIFGAMQDVKQKKLTKLILENVEAEAGDWNSIVDWFDQGFTKDESALKQFCPNSETKVGLLVGKGVGVSVEHKSFEGTGRQDIRCTDGDENCTPVEC